MKRSTDRILTTHAGSLPRPPEVLPYLYDHGARTDEADAVVLAAARKVVQSQANAGVDVLNDGEVSKPAYSTYVSARMEGFGPSPDPTAQALQLRSADFVEFPDFLEKLPAVLGMSALPTAATTDSDTDTTPSTAAATGGLACTGPISYTDAGIAAARHDIEHLQAAAAGVKAEDVFMSAVSPGTVEMFFPNNHYPDKASYLEAVALAMRAEYEAIHQAGLTLQLDCPDLALPAVGTSLADFRDDITLRIEMMNLALVNIPAEDTRIHVCWGNWAIPRKNDVPLGDIIDILLTAKPAGLMLMAANGRHAHEWSVFEDVKLPDGKYIIAGVLDSTTNVIEHPEVVAERLVRYANLVGRENIMAGTDCGFATGAGMSIVAPSVVWAKFQAQAEGAALASSELW